MFRSSLVPHVLLALSQAVPTGARLRAIATAIGARDSSVQRALATLVADRLVERIAVGRRRAYRLCQDHPVARAALDLALCQLPRETALAVLARANPGVEFASLGHGGARPELHVVHATSSTPATRAAFQEAIARLADAPRVLLEAVHEDAADRLLDEPELRERAAAGTILKGTIARSFADPRRHGDFVRARRLHRLHPRLRRPSQRALRRLARSYGLGRIAVFGSAVRADFGPESDVDVLVRYLPTAPHRIADTFALERELEGLFDRDVDVVDEGQLSGRFRPYVEAEEVTLLG